MEMTRRVVVLNGYEAPMRRRLSCRGATGRSAAGPGHLNRTVLRGRPCSRLACGGNAWDRRQEARGHAPGAAGRPRSPGLAAVAASDALITLPGRIARAFAPGFGLVSAEPPIEIRTFAVSVFWHRRNDADPQNVWFRQLILSCVADWADGTTEWLISSLSSSA